MQMHLHYMHILSILLDVQAQKKEPQRDSCTAVSASFAVSVQLSAFMLISYGF